jgi:flagellar hook-associated protein 3 FlgL
MRVSQQMMFDRYVFNMNTSLSSLLELNLKAQTQKEINKPSDDPTGMQQVLSLRDSLRQMDQYQENIDTATGWLGAADETLLQLDTLIIRAKELATQATTGTYDSDNRQQISYEMRSLMEQMIELANMEYEGNSIFAGHKTDTNAFKQVLWLTTNDENLNNTTSFRIEGDSESTVLCQFYDTSGATASGDDISLTDPNLGVRFSSDGGGTWEDATISGPMNGEVSISLGNTGAAIVFEGVDATTVVRANDPDDASDTAGTWAWVRPAAVYQGDDEGEVSVSNYGGNGIAADASGSFGGKTVVVRIDNETAVTMGEALEYSYSMDGGINWVTGNTTQADSSSNAALLSVPTAGILNLSSNGTNVIQPGAQFVIRPRTADIDLNISVDETVTINSVGKEIFGGLWQDPEAVLAADGQRVGLSSSNTSVVFDTGNDATTFFGSNANYSKNLFETMGNLVAFLETNNQEGVQRCLESLNQAQEQMLNKAADIGGRENRVQVAEELVGTLELNVQSRLSDVEDVDVAELMTQLAQQQIVYEAVLRSTSTIMNMNLMKYI